MRGLIADIGVLRELLDQRAPGKEVYTQKEFFGSDFQNSFFLNLELSRHLDKLGMPFAVITTKWFICMFAEVLPIETVLRVWDCLFLEGNKVSHRLFTVIWFCFLNDLLSFADFIPSFTHHISSAQIRNTRMRRYFRFSQFIPNDCQG